jgi:hypothetical protein
MGEQAESKAKEKAAQAELIAAEKAAQAELIAKEKAQAGLIAETQAKLTSEMKAKKKEAKDKSTAEMKDKKKKAEPTVCKSCRHMSFHLGPDYETASKALIALREKGLEVHDVTGDGNCGHCCLLVGLAVLGISKPADQKALRKRLQEKAEHCQTVLRKLPMCQPFDDEGFEEEHSYNAQQLHSEELTHTREFMEKKNKKGECVNEHPWMDLTFVVSLFCYDCRLRVVACCSIGTPEGLINIFHVPHTYS